MPRSKSTLPSTDSSSSSSSSGPKVMSLSDMKMGIDKKQRDLILMDMAASRKKLEEENRMLRDRLEEAEMLIRLLKYKLADHARTKQGVGGMGATSSASMGWFRVKEPKITKKDIREFEKATNQQVTKKKRVKDTFKNPAAPGGKVFTSKTTDENSNYDTNKPVLIVVPVAKQAKKEKEPARSPSKQSSSKPTSSVSPQVKRRPARITKATDIIQHRSVMDRLALSIIEEHRQFDDGLFLDNESDF